MTKKTDKQSDAKPLWKFLPEPMSEDGVVLGTNDFRDRESRDNGSQNSGFRLASDFRDDESRDNGSRNTGFRSVQIHNSSAEIEGNFPPNGRMQVGLGWHPDAPDPRDMLADDTVVRKALSKKAPLLDYSGNLPASISNYRYCSPIENQGSLGSCTAQAAVSLMEYEMKRNGVAHTEGSRLFVYKVTRNLLGWTGDTGAFIRDTIKSIAAFGVPPEKYWKYDIAKFEEEPTPFLYAFGQNYKALNYVRLDPRGQSPKDTINNIKTAVANGYAIIFGFTVFDSMSDAADIPFPKDLSTAKRRGGHAMMIIGYEDDHETAEGVKVPSFVIRNSWGIRWGLGGYGFLPYDYVLKGAAADFWTVYNTSWIQ